LYNLRDLADYVYCDGYSTDVDAFTMHGGLPQIESIKGWKDPPVHAIKQQDQQSEATY
jgi:hypothetical protein